MRNLTRKAMFLFLNDLFAYIPAIFYLIVNVYLISYIIPYMIMEWNGFEFRWVCSVWIKTKWSRSHSVVSDSLQPHGPYSPRNSLGQNTGVGCLPPFQGNFPTQGSNPGFPHCRWILYQLSHKGSLNQDKAGCHMFGKGQNVPNPEK